MSLDAADLRATRFVVAEFTRRRRLAGQAVPPAVARLYCHLMSDNGPEPVVAQEQSEPATELIDSNQAAEILGCTERHVRRIVADIDGHRIAGRWTFNRHTVTEYASEKGAHNANH